MQYDGSGRRGAPVQPSYVPNWPNPAETIEKRRLRQKLNRMGWALVLFEAATLPCSFLIRALSKLFRMQDPVTGSLFKADSLEYQLANLLVYLIVMTVPFLLYALASGFSLREGIPLSCPRGGGFWLGIPVALAVCMLANQVGGMFNYTLETMGFYSTLPDSPIPSSWAARAVYLFSLSVIPALAEELVFRGILMQPLRRYGDHFAVLVSAALFGLMHGNFEQIPFAFVVGLILGFMVVKTGSLWTGIMIHFLNNFFAGVLSIVSEYIPQAADELMTVLYFMILLAAGLVALIFLLKKYPDFFRLKQDPGPLSFRQKINCSLVNPGMIVAVLLFLGNACMYLEFRG